MKRHATAIVDFLMVVALCYTTATLVQRGIGNVWFTFWATLVASVFGTAILTTRRYLGTVVRVLARLLEEMGHTQGDDPPAVNPGEMRSGQRTTHGRTPIGFQAPVKSESEVE